MKKQRVRIAGLILIVCALIMYFSGGYGIIRGSSKIDTERIWNGYYPLLIPPGERGDLIEARAAEVFPVLSARTAQVEYFDFGSFSSVSVAELEARFSPFDSRFDPYMKGLKGYFHSGDGSYEIIYCKSSRNPFSVLLTLRRSLAGLPKDWILIGTNWTVRMVLAGVFLLLMLIALFVPKEKRLMVPVLGLPWLPLVFFGPVQTIMVASVVFYAAVISGTYIQSFIREFLNSGRCGTTKSLLPLSIMLWSLVLLFTIFIIRNGSITRPDALLIVYAVGMNLGVEILLAGLIARKRAKQIHTLFFHIPLATKRRIKLQIIKLIPIPFIMATVITMPIFVTKISPEVETEIPRPGRAEPGKLSYELLLRLDAGKTEGERYLPGIADFFRHRLYQQGWMYKLPYEIPKPGGEYRLSTFQAINGGIVKSDKTVLRIDEDWYSRQLHGTPGTGISNLLMSEDGWAPVLYENTRQTPFKRLEIIVYYIAWFAIQLSGLFSLTHLTAITLYGNKAVELRRQCQAA